MTWNRAERSSGSETGHLEAHTSHAQYENPLLNEASQQQTSLDNRSGYSPPNMPSASRCEDAFDGDGESSDPQKHANVCYLTANESRRFGSTGILIDVRSVLVSDARSIDCRENDQKRRLTHIGRHKAHSLNYCSKP